MATIRHPKDFAAGLMFTGFGILDLYVASSYPLGTAARMGPGYFPRILGMLLIIFGVILALRAFRLVGPPFRFGAAVPPAIVLGSVVLFGIIVPYAGLVVSTLVLIITSSYASSEFRWKEAIGSGIVLATVAIAGFVWGLGLQFSVWPTFLGGS
ncbi:MAG: tripartite tricarboxylate transporter TctB family protein [Casimicrobiaceae bacterium]